MTNVHGVGGKAPDLRVENAVLARPAEARVGCFCLDCAAIQVLV